MIDHKVNDYQIRQNPNDPSEIIVYQHGANNHELLKSQLSFKQDCQPFKIKAFEFSPLSLRSLHFADDGLPGHVLPFALEKSVKAGLPIPTATVGLVLKGQDPSRCSAGECGDEYFGVSTAHAVLDEVEQRTLSYDNMLSVEKNGHKRIWKRVVADLTENSWSLRAHNEGGIHSTGIPIFSYSKYYRLAHDNVPWFRKFSHDIILFKLDKEDLERKGWMEEDPATGIKLLQIHTSPFSHAQHPEHAQSKILGILQVWNSWDIQLLEQARVNIVVADTTGYVIKSPCISYYLELKHGLQICFVTKSRFVKRL